MSKIDELIKEGEEHLKHYLETKEELINDPEIPDIVKEINIGLGEALIPTLEILRKEKWKKK
jgi:hypothetical protein